MVSSLDQQMLDDALAAQKFTRKHFVAELNFSLQSLADLDAQFDAVRYALRGGLSPENIAQLQKLWGAYLGEVLRRLTGGAWIEPESTASHPGIRIQDATYWPFEQIAQRFRVGATANLQRWTEEIIQQHRR